MKFKKILFLAGTPGLLKNNNKYNGGGWIASLQQEIMQRYSKDIEIALAYHNDQDSFDEYEGVQYYGVKSIKHTFWKYKKKEKVFCKRIQDVIEEVKPDVILCFGTENGLGLACTLTEIPVIIHIQGILNPLYEAYMPQGMSWFRWLWGNKQAVLTWLALKEFKKREMKMFRYCKYFLGRTEWDQMITNLLAPQAKYFYCSEMLREEIYNSGKSWKLQQNKVKRIVSIISGSIYKGGDVILRAAQLLKDNVSFEFVWEVYGVTEMKKWEKLTGVKHENVDVEVKGVITAIQLVDIVTNADVYVHPSYIENSPNSVCEAQLLGIPVIATNVGGTSALVKHMETGVLVPSNDSYYMASYIMKILEDEKFAEKLGGEGRKEALERHSSQKIVKDLMEVLKQVDKSPKSDNSPNV